MRIPVRDQQLVNIYRCGHCNGTFLAQDPNYRVSCAVNHSPGTCCHYGEKAVPEETLVIVKAALV
jgi:hypothetical protein